MKKTTLLKTMLLLCALVVGSSNLWAADVVYKTQQFSSETFSKGTSAYTSVSFDNTYDGFKCNYSNFNNNNKAWNFVKCGGKNGAYTGTITTDAAIDKAITKVAVTIDAITTANVTSIKLYKSSDKSVWTELGEFDKSTGAKEVAIASPVADLYYKIEFVCTQGTGNGLVTVSKLQFYTQSYNITAVSNNDSYGTVSLEGFTITATPESGYRVISGAGGYTVSSGTAIVTNNGDNTFTVEPSSDCTVTINFEAIPSHTATFSINGVEESDDYLEGEDIIFPSDPSNLGGKEFKGWIKTPIVGTTGTEPAEYYTSGVMSTADVTYYAVFAKKSTGEGNVTLTITKDTENFPDSYGSANTFTEYTLEGKKFKIQQAYVNSGKLQWRAAGNSNGTGTMYNTEALSKIQSIVLTYDGDSNKNFTVTVGDSENPTSGTSITPSTSGDVSTFDCSSYNNSYFVMANGSGAGYLASIAITYRGTTTIYDAYCTSVDPVSVSVGIKGYATYCNATSALDFTGKSIAAYTISSTDGIALTLTQKNKVAKDEPVLLYSSTNSDSQTIPVIADAEATTDANNKLKKGDDASHTWVEGTAEHYVLATATVEPGFYRANSNTVASTKAYLDLTGLAPEAHAFTLDLGEGNTTGIATISSEKETMNGAFYNLAGQRVTQPTKGLYIMNGRKVIVK